MLLSNILEAGSQIVEDLGRSVTEVDFAKNAQRFLIIAGSDKTALECLGITLLGRTDCNIVVVRTDVRIGRLTLLNLGERNTFLFGNEQAPRECNLSLRVAGSGCNIFFPDLSQSPINIANAYLRSDEQLLYWGAGATSVTSRIEIEGVGRRIVIGDDCMLSSGVWLRNHDMHTIFDVNTLERLNHLKSDITIEQHVWLGFDVIVLSSPRIGYGSIVGARSLVKQAVPSESMSVGSPAKTVRTGVSWCRSERDVQQVTLRRLERIRMSQAARPVEGSDPSVI